MSLPVDALGDAMQRLDSMITQAVQRAGQGLDPHLERRLDSLAFRLASLLDARGAALVNDASELAKRVMDAADPHAPQLMLQLARENLQRALRRHTPRRPAQAAA